MSDLEVKTAVAAGRIVVALTGDCDLRNRDILASSLVAAVEAAPVVIVDLAAVRFLDSSGLYALVSAHQAARSQARSLHVVNASGTVATILEMTGVMALLRPPDDGDGSVRESAPRS